MKKLLLTYCIFILLVTSSYGFSLKDSVQKTLVSNPDVIAERKNQEAYRYYVDEKQSKYLPTLDFNAYLEKSRVKDKYDDREHTDNRKDGYNAALVLRQLIYDGGLTPSEISEMKHQDLANKYRSLNAIENIVLETTKAYTTLVKYDELIALSDGMIKTNQNNLTIAKEKEQISGEVLETYQVSSKLHFATDKFYEEQSNRQDQLNALKKYVGVDITQKVCRPAIDESVLPSNMETLLKKAVLSNYQIKEQIEKIKSSKGKK